jgi:hypothetical protein
MIKMKKTFGREETTSDLQTKMFFVKNVTCIKMYKNVTNKIKELKGDYTIDVQ